MGRINQQESQLGYQDNEQNRDILAELLRQYQELSQQVNPSTETFLELHLIKSQIEVVMEKNGQVIPAQEFSFEPTFSADEEMPVDGTSDDDFFFANSVRAAQDLLINDANQVSADESESANGKTKKSSKRLGRPKKKKIPSVDLTESIEPPTVTDDDEELESFLDAQLSAASNSEEIDDEQFDEWLLSPEDELQDDGIDAYALAELPIDWDGGIDLFKLYTKDIAHDLLTAEEELALGRRISAGKEAKHKLEKMLAADRQQFPDLVNEWEAVVADGQQAEEKLVSSNFRLVISQAKKHMYRGVPFMDLIQEGNIGLLKAVRKYEYQRGFRFSTLATWWIRQGITRAVADQANTIRIPVHIGDRMRNLGKQITAAQQELGDNTTHQELAVHLGVKVSVIDAYFRLLKLRPLSLEGLFTDDGAEDAGMYEEKMGVAPEQETNVEQNELRAYLTQVLKDLLPEREYFIIDHRFGLSSGEGETLEAISRKIGVTRERVRQLETQALDRIRRSSKSVPLAAFLRGSSSFGKKGK